MANNNTGIIVAGIAILALFMRGSGKKSCGNKYIIPAQYSSTGVAREVCESDLPGLGFVRYQGLWYHPSQLLPAGAQVPTGQNAVNWASTIQNLISSGMSIYAAVNQIYTAAQNSGSSGSSNYYDSSIDTGNNNDWDYTA